MWGKTKAWFKHSVTILWARAMTLGGAVLATLVSLSSDPNVGAAIQSVLQPRFIPYYVIAIGILTEMARRRTVDKATTSANKVIG